ncbi:MAG: metalloregulator ArsR/SmtB family transcription factor [Verrucomicrobiota bacterium]
MLQPEASLLRGVWKALNDPTRVRLMALVREAELSVSEIQQVTLLSQSLISAHLAVLRKVELVQTRKEGKSIFYEGRSGLDPSIDQIVWAALATLQEIPDVEKDRTELKSVLRKRREATQSYFNKIAGKLGKAYCPGRTWSAVGPALAHMIGEVDIADMGAGEGWLTLLLAQRARKVYAVDNSPNMVEFGQSQLKANKISNVEYRLGQLEDPPLEAGSVDLVVFSQALHHAENPERAIRQATELLREGGSVVVLDLQKHQFDKARELYYDHWLGFTESDLRGWFKQAGLGKVLIQTLEADPNDPGFTPLLASAKKY